MAGASLVSGLLVVACMLNLALLIRFYKSCFAPVALRGKEPWAAGDRRDEARGIAAWAHEGASPISKGKAEEDLYLRALLNGEHAQIMMMGFSTSLGLTSEVLNIKMKNELERIRLKGALLFQKALYDKQISQCREGKKVALYRMPRNHRYGFFSQVQGIAHSLLDAFAHDHVLSWNNTITFYVDPIRCPSRSFECLFMPITSCDSLSESIKDSKRNSCVMEFPRTRMHEQAFVLNSTDEWQDMVEVLRNKAGLAILGHREIFNAHFFVTEALRFVMRPNVHLKRATKEIFEKYFPIPKGWRPLQGTVSRVAVQIRAGDDKKAHTGVLGPEYYVKAIQRLAPNSLKQVLISSDNRAFQDEFVSKLLEAFGPCSKPGDPQIQVSFIPSEQFGSNSSVTFDSRKQRSEYDTGTLLSAQSFIFASTDAFFGFYGSNIATTTAALMSALRMSSFSTPAFDVGGSPWCACNHLKQYPWRNLKHPSLK